VIRAGGSPGDAATGLMVDGISEVHDLDDHDLCNLPGIGSRQSQDLVHGIARTAGKTIVLLNEAQLSLSAAAAATTPSKGN
jgi:chemotaxis signal transduction protein